MSIKNKIYTKKICLENKDEMTLHYYLTEKQSNDGKLYGIEIEKYLNKHDKCIYEHNAAHDLSYNFNYIKEIIETIANGFVTPISLDAVLDNLMDGVS